MRPSSPGASSRSGTSRTSHTQHLDAGAGSSQRLRGHLGLSDQVVGDRTPHAAPFQADPRGTQHSADLGQRRGPVRGGDAQVVHHAITSMVGSITKAADRLSAM